MARMDRKDWLTPWEQGFDAGVAGKTEADNPFPYVDGSPYEGPTENEQWSEGLVIGKLRKLRDDYAALEAERDELAARLRAVKDSLNHESNVETTDDFRICRSALLDLVTALDGPAPECRACAEMRSDIGALLRIADHGGYVLKSTAYGFLARHAADEGEK